MCAAHPVKALALLGLRPSFTLCARCGAEVARHDGGDVRVSFREGGVLCADCASLVEARVVPQGALAWCEALLGSTFSQIEDLKPDLSASFSVLRFCQEWTKEHVGFNLKSLNFLFTCGLF